MENAVADVNVHTIRSHTVTKFRGIYRDRRASGCRQRYVSSLSSYGLDVLARRRHPKF